MEYRKLGRTGLDVSAIGLGIEHFEPSRETRDTVLRTAVDAGVTYVDLVYIEPDYWDDFGPVLRPYRQYLVGAAHWGWPDRYDMAYCHRCFDHILSHMGNDYVEVGMLTMVDTQTKWRNWGTESVERLLDYKAKGHVGYVGMSSHRPPIAIEAVNSGLIDVLMYPLNLTSYAIEEDMAVCRACAEQDVALVAMKPYHGGRLFLGDGTPSPVTPAQCLHFVLSQPVSTTVPGVKNEAELRATLHYLEATEEEKAYDSIIGDMRRYRTGECTYCNHCLPCPEGIDIGRTNHLSDAGRVGQYITDEILAEYAALEVKASECSECGLCVDRCPYEVDVISKMRQAVEFFEAGA